MLSLQLFDICSRHVPCRVFPSAVTIKVKLFELSRLSVIKSVKGHEYPQHLTHRHTPAVLLALSSHSQVQRSPLKGDEQRNGISQLSSGGPKTESAGIPPPP